MGLVFFVGRGPFLVPDLPRSVGIAQERYAGRKGATMLPDEYQIDEQTCQRLEEETGVPLPEGAVEALYTFEQENPEAAESAGKRLGNSRAESTWLRAEMFARLGPYKYAEHWANEIERELRSLEEMRNIPLAAEYVIDGFRIRNVGPEPVDHEGEWSIKNRWEVTDDGAEEPLMSIFLDDDAPVEKILRKFTGWTRQVQGEDEDHPL